MNKEANLFYKYIKEGNIEEIKYMIDEKSYLIHI